MTNSPSPPSSYPSGPSGPSAPSASGHAHETSMPQGSATSPPPPPRGKVRSSWTSSTSGESTRSWLTRSDTSRRKAKAFNLWPSTKPDIDAPAPIPLPPAPSYETIKIVATRSEDIAAVRASAAHLQLTWALYQELGRPSHLIEAVERQLDSLARSVNRLSGLPTSSIAVPIPEEPASRHGNGPPCSSPS